jgi:hypothetical protein
MFNISIYCGIALIKSFTPHKIGCFNEGVYGYSLDGT